MDKQPNKTLEDFIRDNKDLFEAEALPKDDKIKFLNKLQVIDNKNSKNDNNIRSIKNIFSSFKIRYIAISSVAVLALFFTIMVNRNDSAIKEIESIQALENMYNNKVKKLADDIIKEYLDSHNEKTEQEIDSNIKSAIESLTDETIPLSEQLPEYADKEELYKIIKEYYSQKMEGLHRMKLLLANNELE